MMRIVAAAATVVLAVCSVPARALRGTGILPVGLCGIGILPMIHGLEAHATVLRYAVSFGPESRLSMLRMSPTPLIAI